MPFLVVGGITLHVSTFRRTTAESGGGTVRALSGQLRGDPLWVARSWEATAIVTDDTTANNLYNAVDDGFSNVSCSGDALGATVICRVSISDEHQMIDGGWYRVFSLTLRESL